jgi:hypothetical protein
MSLLEILLRLLLKPLPVLNPFPVKAEAGIPVPMSLTGLALGDGLLLLYPFPVLKPFPVIEDDPVKR